MSGWAAYITNLHASSGAIKRSAIVGYPTGEVWARSEGGNTFSANATELASFVKAFDDINGVPSTGVDLEGVHYIVPRVEDNLIFGKKDRTGLFAAKTKSAVLIAIYEGENAVSSEVRTAVEKLADYLKTSGY